MFELSSNWAPTCWRGGNVVCSACSNLACFPETACPPRLQPRDFPCCCFACCSWPRPTPPGPSDTWTQTVAELGGVLASFRVSDGPLLTRVAWAGAVRASNVLWRDVRTVWGVLRNGPTTCAYRRVGRDTWRIASPAAPFLRRTGRGCFEFVGFMFRERRCSLIAVLC